MRIVRVADVTGDVPGGMNLFMRRGGEALQDLGHEVDYLFREALAPGVPRRLRRLLTPWVVVWKLWQQCRSARPPDVVEIHEPLAAPYCFVRRRFPRSLLVPCVAISYGSEERRWAAAIDRGRVLGKRPRFRESAVTRALVVSQASYALKHADHVLVPSDRDYDYLHERLHIPTESLTRVDSGVDDRYFELESAAWNGQPRILFIGTWIDRKGIRELVQAWSTVSAANPHVRLTAACTVVSAGDVIECFDRARDRVAVHQFATDDELVDIIASHHVFVLPAWFEGGIPLAVLQAAGAGLPCVVTEIAGHVEVFRPDDPVRDGGILVPSHDGPAVADALSRLISDAGLAQRLGESARRRAMAFTWSENARASLNGYASALGKEPPPVRGALPGGRP
jgi:glycosyltransferase involved in cell wall biosynthesis